MPHAYNCFIVLKTFNNFIVALMFNYFNLVMRATSLLVFRCYFVPPSLNKDFTYLLTINCDSCCVPRI